MRVDLSPAAEKDLADILDYLFALSPISAFGYIDDIVTFCHDILAHHPEIGRFHEDVLSGTRIIPIRNHLILYDVLEDSLSINRIIHGARDLSVFK